MTSEVFGCGLSLHRPRSRQTLSNSPPWTAAMNAAHCVRPNSSTPPSGSLESRTPTTAQMRAGTARQVLAEVHRLSKRVEGLTRDIHDLGAAPAGAGAAGRPARRAVIDPGAPA